MQTKQYITDLQRNEAGFAQLATQIRSIGIGFVATASGYSVQTIKNYLTLQQGSQKLENSIVENLSKASELKLEASQKKQKLTVKDVLQTARQRTREAFQTNKQELEKISEMLDQFEQTVTV